MITALRFVRRESKTIEGRPMTQLILQHQIVTEEVVLGSDGKIIGSSISPRWEDVPILDEETMVDEEENI